MGIQFIDSVLFPLQNVTVICHIVDSLLRPGRTLRILHGINDLRLECFPELRIDIPHKSVDIRQMACVYHRCAVLVSVNPHLKAFVHLVGIFSSAEEFLVNITVSGYVCIWIVAQSLKNRISLADIFAEECTIRFSVCCHIAVDALRRQTPPLQILRNIDLLFHSKRSSKVFRYRIHEFLRCQRARTYGCVLLRSVIGRIGKERVAFDVFRQANKPLVFYGVHSGGDSVPDSLGIFHHGAVNKSQGVVHRNCIVHVFRVSGQRERSLTLSVESVLVHLIGDRLYSCVLIVGIRAIVRIIVDIFILLCYISIDGSWAGGSRPLRLFYWVNII